MANPRGFTLVVCAGILTTSLLFGCSRDLPTSTSGVSATLAVRGLPQPTVDFVLLSDASGFVRRLPELGILESGTWDLQSTYFKTTETNREFRRGFAEFVIPGLPDGFLSARVVLHEHRAWISLPVPPDRHGLSSYADADLVVDASDYDRSTLPVGTFETDANLETMGSFTFDVTSVVAQQRGSALGFRVKL